MGFRTFGIALLVASLAVPATARCTGIARDMPHTTAAGHRFVAPAGWRVSRAGAATIVAAPEGDSRVVLLELAGSDPDRAVAAAWSEHDPAMRWPLEKTEERPPRFTWAQVRAYRYDAPESAARVVFAHAFRHGERWTVALGNLSRAVVEAREAELTRLLGGLWPRGYVHVPESFAGKRAHRLDAARLEALTRFVENARGLLDIPGVALGIVQDGEVVFAGGFGERALGRRGAVDADTLFLSASITKPLTTLMLARLVDAGRFDWESPVTDVLPEFRVGDAALTRQLRMKHLVCACTGLPRQDLEWVFASESLTPASLLASLARMQPTAGLGEVYQYSNPIAAAAGYVGAHALHPERELGAAYDASMQEQVFDPLGMTATTFDYVRAQRGNHAAPHGRDIDGTTVRARMDFNYSAIPLRPDGGAWSSVNDLLRYLRMELADGRLTDGRRYIGEAALLARRAPQVARGGEGQSYGMGLKIDHNRGTPVIWHGGTMAGYQTDLQWLPEHGVGYVLLMNADAGMHLRALFPRRLLEVLFDAEPQAAANLALAARRYAEELQAERARLVVPADAAQVAQLALRYRNPELGELAVEHKGGATWFDFGLWDSEVATQRDGDGARAFVTISPSVAGYRFTVAEHAGRRALRLGDGQREYLFTEEEPLAAR